MADAVVAATARSPIGRAFKGSPKDLRPDDLTAAIVRAALDKVPQLDPADVDDLMLGQAPRRNISRQQFKEMLMAHHAVSAIECRKAIARRQTARGAGTAGPAHE